MADPQWLDDDQQRAWRGLVALLLRLPPALDRQLQDEADIVHPYYMVLAMLSEAPGRALRMTELAQITNTSPSRLSHAVSRLQERGWITRHPCATDGRGMLAILTDEGFAALAAAAPGHVAQVRRTVFDKLSTDQVRQLEEITTAITAGLDPSPTAAE